MGRFINSSDTKKIQADWWEKDEFVVIKKFTWAERRRLEGATLGGGITFADETRASLDVYETAMLKLEMGIVSWTFKDGDKDVALTRRNLERLSEEDGNYIESQIDEYNPDVVLGDEDERIAQLRKQLDKAEKRKAKK